MSKERFEHFMECEVPDIHEKDIWIFGAGNTAWLCQEGLKRLRDEGFVLRGYSDNDSKKWGGYINHVPIASLEEMRRCFLKKRSVALACSAMPESRHAIGSQLESMGMEWYSLDEMILKLHKKEVGKCYEMLWDDLSREIYASVLSFRMYGSELDFCPVDDRYFALPSFKELDIGEVYIDCGAYIGDSVERFIWRREGIFKRIVAFEPNAGNFKAMENRIKRLKSEWNIGEDKISLFPYGVGDGNETCFFDNYEKNHGLSAKFVAGADEGEKNRIISLDDFFDEPYSFLKADIESYEYKMICGAKEGIKKYKPLLAIAIYHNAVDLFQIPLLIKELVPEYHIAIRHHSYGWDDTVVYAWI